MTTIEAPFPLVPAPLVAKVSELHAEALELAERVEAFMVRVDALDRAIAEMSHQAEGLHVVWTHDPGAVVLDVLLERSGSNELHAVLERCAGRLSD